MKEELLAMQVQIDLMNRVIAELVSQHDRGMGIAALAFKAAKERERSEDPVVSKAAKEWGENWFPHKPYMDSPMYQ